MKIFYASDSTIPSELANSIHVMKMAQALAHNGHDVTLLAAMPSGQAPVVEQPSNNTVDLFERYGVGSVFTLQRLSRPVLRLWGAMWYALQSSRRLQQANPQLVYARDLGAAAMAVLSAYSTVLELHQPPTGLKLWLLQRIAANPKLRRVVLITQTLEARVLSDVPALKGRTLVAADGADTWRQTPEPANLRAPVGAINVGYTGHLYPGKGMEVLVGVARMAPDLHLHIVGGNPKDIAHWQHQCQGLPNVIFYGRVDHAQVPSYLQAMDVLLLPNQNKVAVHGSGNGDIGQWTSPLKAFEYMAAGKPIVASRLPVLQEVFTDQRNALLCDPIHAHEWVQAIRRILADSSLATQLATHARNDLETRYSWFHRAQLVLEGLD